MVEKIEYSDKNIIMTIGPDYLYYTSTIYIIEQLISNGNKLYIILDELMNKVDDDLQFIVENSLKDISKDINIIKIFSDKNFIITELKRYSALSNIFKSLKDKIDFALLHALVFREPIPYVMNCMKFNIEIVTYQQGLMSKDIILHHKLYRNYKDSLKGRLKSFVFNKFFPFIFFGKYYIPVWDVFINRLNVSTKYKPSNTLMFSSIEANFLINQNLSKKVTVNKFPMIDNHLKLNNILYNDINKESNNMLILPTVGVFDYAIKNKNIKKEQIINHYSDVLLRIGINENINRILVKLHPSEISNDIWIKICTKLDEKFDCDIIKNISAEKLILENKIIISEYSTVLWWASFYSTKNIYALNLFNLPLFDHYKDFNNINYLEN
jgi:DNA polymerase III delta prime subunit